MPIASVVRANNNRGIYTSLVFERESVNRETVVFGFYTSFVKTLFDAKLPFGDHCLLIQNLIGRGF